MTIREQFRKLRAEEFRSNPERLLRIQEVLDTEVFKRKDHFWGWQNIEDLSHGDLLYAFRELHERYKAERLAHNETLARALDLDRILKEAQDRPLGWWSRNRGDYATYPWWRR